ncbi:MAG: ATP-binding protein [Thalassolituus oleivorans]|nr:ATP-binding protein [Thalassolituus oleivorans]
MIKPNWDVFKAKFSDNPQHHFEWFCYLLFCKEFNRPCGIFRYKNQSAIETNPIDLDSRQLGFQSRFYETSLSSNKEDLLEMLDRAKRDYQNLTKLFLYTNQEWSQAFSKKNNPNRKAKKPLAQQEIDDKAVELGIELEWRAQSYFESPFVVQDCAKISKYFFVEENSLPSLVGKQVSHTENILRNIKDEILFSGYRISIERPAVLDSLKNNDSQVTIIFGQGGIGKTVEIKKLYQSTHDSRPLFVFKATEFELSQLDNLMKQGNVEDFLTFFDDNNDKTIVIDSAEKLLDLKNQEAIKEFINLSLKYDWRVIFTTREHYFDDLNYLCLDVLGVTPSKIYIPELTKEELYNLSSQYNFEIPTDQRLKQLLTIPFYLNEYLQFYDDRMEQPFSYSNFKDHLWNKKIKNNDIKREQVFGELALKRANEGKFYLSVEAPHLEAAKALAQDEVLGAEGASFFISHDIYEEWALEKFIDIEFKNRSSNENFFNSVGQSLPIRRSFRLWLSEQLRLNKEGIKTFIERTMGEESLESIWKDELMVAILLSDYSDFFFEYFEDELVTVDLKLLQRICFTLRIACKEIDNSILPLIGIKQRDRLSHSLFFTQPKGSGWTSLINFVYSHIEQIGINNLSLFVPVFYEWNSFAKKGDTTRKASLLCIEYYKWLESDDSYFLDSKFSDSIVKTIAYGANEVKEELIYLINEMGQPRAKSGRCPFEHLAKLILKDTEGLRIAGTLPEKTFELAINLWLVEHKQDHNFSYHMEEHHIFGVTDDVDFHYNPESALQTPIFYMLGLKPKETIDFILKFINQTTLNIVNHYGEENFETQNLIVGGATSKIYLDRQLWDAYRGAGSAPDLIKSVLMALEKYFLENATKFEDDDLELWLKYILMKTNSSAICGVVSSVVLANKDTLFNVAKILFGIKEFIQFDNERLYFDGQRKTQLEIVGNMFESMPHEKICHDERISACDAEHRTDSLESIFLYYQLFARKDLVRKPDIQNKQKELWEILDKYYRDLESNEDSEESKLWRFCLARMDRRKMDITAQIQGDKIALNFNAELAPDLKEMSEITQVKRKLDFKYLPLKLWASNKLDQHEDYKEYKQYESSPNQAASDLKELLGKLTDEQSPPTEDFVLFNHSTPCHASVTLIKYHHKEIDEDDLNLCIEIIIGSFNNIYSEEYRYQIGDGIKFCFEAIPDIFSLRPELRPDLKVALLAGLFREDPIDMWGNHAFYHFAINAVHRLWQGFEKDAESILKGYLLLKPKYSDLIIEIKQEIFEKEQFDVKFDDLWRRFFRQNKNFIEEVCANTLSEEIRIDLSGLDINTKTIALLLIPNNGNKLCQETFLKLVESTALYLLSEERHASGDFRSKIDFLEKYTDYVLKAPNNLLPNLLKPFLEGFNSSEGASDLLERFVHAQNRLAAYENFWSVWGLLKPEIIKLSQSGHLYYRNDKIIRAYLFALPWREDVKSWHTFKDKNAKFFNEMAKKLSNSSSTLFAISKLLNDIGSCYLSDGAYWIAEILRSNPNLTERDMDTNTIYYLNAFIREYLYKQRSKIRKSPELKSEVLVILDFLIEHGEVSGYLMRESIV